MEQVDITKLEKDKVDQTRRKWIDLENFSKKDIAIFLAPFFNDRRNNKLLNPSKEFQAVGSLCFTGP